MALLVLVSAALGASARAVSAQPPSDSPRLVIVLGDMHMGVGRDASGAWHSYEDFRWAGELGLFLDAVNAEGGGATDLILNGDTFELWQSREDDCVYADAALGCTEAEAMARLERVLAAHELEMTALARFARAGSNRVVLVPGDHDAALLFPSIARRAVEAMGGPEGRVAVATAGAWRSADGQIYAEHGHQIGARASRLDDWPAPFVQRSGRTHLVRPWGAQTVAGFFTARETRYPTVDNFADEGAGLKYALAADGATDLGDAAAPLLRYVLFRMPWQQFRVDLDAGDVQPPVWDLPAVRAEGPAFLVESLPDDDRFKPVAAAAFGDGRLADLMDALTDEEITGICDYRAAVRRARRRFERPLTQIDPQGPPVAECPRMPGSRGGLFDDFWRTRDRIYSRRLEAAQAQGPPAERPIAIFVHGHTHLVDWRQRVLESTSLGREVVVDGFSPVRNALTPIVINGGAWQRTITPVQFERLQQALGVSDAELLGALQPEALAPCYSFVRIEPYDDAPPPPTIRYWRQIEGGAWEMAGACGRQPSGGR